MSKWKIFLQVECMFFVGRMFTYLWGCKEWQSRRRIEMALRKTLAFIYNRLVLINFHNYCNV